jgi:hypothetical protein
MILFIFQKNTGHQENKIIEGSNWRCSKETLFSFGLWM